MWVEFLVGSRLAPRVFLLVLRFASLKNQHFQIPIGPLHDPVTQWDFQNKGKSGWTGTSSFVLDVPLRYLRPSMNLFRTM